MAMQIGSKGIQSEINVTPLIDVVLVLLIIFMVVVPLVERRFILAVPEKDLPQEELPEDSPKPLLVMLEADGSVKLNDQVLPMEQLLDKLHTVLRRRDEKVVFFDAAKSANYGQAVDVMDACRGVGARHIGIIDPAAVAGELPEAPVEALPSP
ncbi:MAG: biopolymer transporter ExbD [Pseudomonadota bacterium]